MKDNAIPLELNTGQGANRFKYQNFKTRVELLKVDVVRRSRVVDDEPDEHGSFFYEALMEWKDLNMTRNFKDFAREITPLVKSLPSIIYHKDTIVSILEKHLLVKDSMALDGLLDLVTKLAKDLEGEFYPYYPRMLSCVLPLVYHQDIKLLESVFNCIAYLFKFLSRQILPDLDQTFHLLTKLLGEDNQAKPYIRHFTAEAFAFLLRKARGTDLTKIIKCIIDALKAEPAPQFEEGLAMLFFESIKQIDHRIHSRGEAIYKELLVQSCSQGIAADDIEKSPVHSLLTKTTLLTLHHTYRQHFTPIIQIVLNELERQTKKMDENVIAIPVSLLTMIVTVRKGSRVEDFKPIIAAIQDLAKLIFSSKADTYSNYLYTQVLCSVVGALSHGSLEAAASGGRVILDTLDSFDDIELIYGFYLSLAKLKWSNYTQICLPHIIKYSSTHFSKYPYETILFLSEVLSTDALALNPGTLSSSLTPEGLLRFPNVASNGGKTIVEGILDLLGKDYDWKTERDRLNATDMKAEESTMSAITILASALRLLPKVHVSVDKVFTVSMSLFVSLSDFLKKNAGNNDLIETPFVLAHENFVLETLMGLVLESLAGIAANNAAVFKEMKNIHGKLVDEVLVQHSRNEVVLSGIYRYLDLLHSGNADKEKFSLQKLEKLYPVLKLNLSSYRRNCRLNTLKIIALFDQPIMKTDQDHKLPEVSDIARIALNMEQVDASFKDYRDKVVLIQKLNLITSSKRTPDLYVEFAPRLSLGILTVNLRPLWDEAKKLLVTFSQVNAELYWDLMYGEILKYNDEKSLVWDGFARDVLTKLNSPDEPENTNATKTGKISFECPTLNTFTHMEHRAWSIIKTEKAQSLALLFAGLSQQAQGHMDFWNYYTLMLLTLKETPTITEARGRNLVVLFFHFLETEFTSAPEDEDEDNEADEDKDRGDTTHSGHLEILPRNSKIIKNKMANWLALFAVFKNTRAVYKSHELNAAFMRIIAMGDAKLQLAAMECLFTWKDPNIKPYADNLRNLVDDIKFRDELTTFIQNEEQVLIDPAHRQGLMPVVMRVLYGRLIQRSKASSKSSKNARRKIILGGISCCKPEEIRIFIDLALEPFKPILELSGVETDQEGNVTSFDFAPEGYHLIEQIAWRKQTGLLNMMEDTIKQFATHILPFLPDLLKVLLYMINFAHGRKAKHDEDAMQVDEEAGSEQSNKSKQVKALALKRIVDVFKINGDFNFTPFIPCLFSAFISARLPTLPTDASQDLSTLVNLFLVWSKKSTYAPYLVDYDDRVIPQIVATLSVKSLSEHVLNILLEIFESLLSLCDDEMDIDGEHSLKEKLIIPHVDLILNHLRFRLTQSKDDKKFSSGRYSVREISITARVAPYTKNGEQAATIIELLLPSLKKPSRTIPEKTKQDIFTIWAKFIRIVPGFEAGSPLYHHYYVMASSIFATAYSRESRVGLLEVFHAFAIVNPELAKVDELLTMLNAYSQKRIDEPDYDAMLDALSAIGETYYDKFTVHQWLPILHQMFHCMHNVEEMAIRGTATHCMSQYLKATAEQTDEEEKRKMLGYVNHVVYPAIKRGLRSRVELVRMEFVSLLCACIKRFPELPIFEDMVPLLGDGNEEVNFFNNVYHMQIHRRVRALLRLSEFVETGKLKVATINSIFIPIISAFFKESDRTVDHNLLHQCTLALSSLAKVLPWNHYYRLLQNYLGYIKENDEKERLFVRVVIGILDAFHFDLQNIELSDEIVKKIMGRQKVRIDYLTNEEIMKQAAKDAGKVPEEDVKNAEHDDDEDQEQVEAADTETEAKDKNEKIHDILVSKVMPELNNLLNNNKSRRSVIVRVPLALGIAKLLCHLPEKSKRVNLPGLLTSVCHIIRSRAQDVRDITRETLFKISAFLGASYFNYIVKELRGALKKGYELHVLGYTVNALLLDMMPRLKVGDLDYCLRDLVDVLVNDIFGATGQEKDADEMTRKIKEAKSRRSPASFELIAKITHFKNVGLLLVPLKDIMSNTESSRILRKVEDLLRRIALGLVNNPEFESLELLDFAYNLINENLDDFKAQPKTKVKKTQKELNFEVQMKRVMVESVDHYRTNAFRFVYFGLSLLSSAIKKTKFDLANDEYISRLRKLVNAVGNTLYASQSANVVLAARIMCHFIPMKIPNIQSAVAVSIERSFALIKSSGGSQTTTVQACLRLITVCIRDNDKSSLSEAQLTYILNFVRPDMEELERQGIIFALIRAIISRKFMAPEIYELMDSVSNVMVTNQSKEIREQARSVFFMFLMDYPQGKGRLRQQMSFIVKNLEYVYESGRESIMELLHHIISKFGSEILADYIDSIFFALVMRLINDESSKCREMAASLIKSLFSRSTERLPTFYKLLNKWLEQSSKPNLQRAACQVYGLAIDTFGTQLRPQAAGLVQRLATILQASRERADELAQEYDAKEEQEQEQEQESMDIDTQWEVTYYAINTFAKITKTFPKIVYDQETESVWRGMQYMLLYHHSWIRSSSARLYGVYFSGIDAESRMIKDTTTKCTYLDRETLCTLAADFLEQLKSNHVTQDQADQIVKNLFFIGKCFYYMPDKEDDHDAEEIKIDDARDEVLDEEKGSKAAQDALAKIAQSAHKRSLNWLFRKASFDARGAAIRKIKSAIILRSSIFKLFAAICNTMTAEEIPPYLMPVIAPIYRTVNDEQNKAAGFEALQQLGNEVLNLLQNKAGPTIYFAVYQRVRQQVIKSREERKSKDAILAISNPALAAKRKLDKHQRSQNKKKRARF
ncbi:armadillo-type protein [Parasitella parasitica]|nr:armadillo-type protein [Parasitella parasitica]